MAAKIIVKKEVINISNKLKMKNTLGSSKYCTAKIEIPLIKIKVAMFFCVLLLYKLLKNKLKSTN